MLNQQDNKAMARKPKEQKVILVVPKHGLSQEFGIQHAERLLDMGTLHNGGWELPTDSKYVYDEENGLRVKTDKASN